MIELKRVLLPTDFSELSSEATKYACALAEQFDAQLHMLHVHENIVVPEYAMGIDWDKLAREARSAAEAQMEEVLDPAWKEAHKVVKATAEGPPFLEIIRYAKERDIDLIVMATHGRSGVSHMLIGSVAEKVVRKAPCPVLTVRPKGHQFVMP